MTKDEALKLALEALDRADKISGYPNNKKAIAAIKEALAQPEPVIDKSAATRIATSLGWEPKRTWVGLTDVLDFIEEFTGAERERHPMFSDGYDLALSHVKELVEAKLKEKNT